MLINFNWRNKLSQPLRNPIFSKELNDRHHLIIELSGRHPDKVAALVDNVQGTVYRELKLIPSLVIEFPYYALEELGRFRYVKKIWHDAPVYTRLDIAVPEVGGIKAQNVGFTGKGIVVVVLDTGLYPHFDFRNRIIAWNDLLNQKSLPYDDNGHGTHIAGIIAGNGFSSHGKYKGMAPEAALVGVKVLDQKGSGSVSNVIAGIEWCLENQQKLNIKVINLSMGSTAQESYQLDPLCRATTAAWNKGLLVCAAAGNEGPEAKTINTPGINPQIITVGNTDNQKTLSPSDDQLNRTSSRGPTIDNLIKPNILAPGTNITSTWINGGYHNLTGTSMSTPMVSGAAALILQLWPTMSPHQIKRLLMKNARDLGLSPNLQGAGVLNLNKIFNLANQNPSHWLDIREILGYHLLERVMKKMGVDSPFFANKRNEAIKKTLFSLINLF